MEENKIQIPVDTASFKNVEVVGRFDDSLFWEQVKDKEGWNYLERKEE
jgi:hypothetical protein